MLNGVCKGKASAELPETIKAARGEEGRERRKRAKKSRETMSLEIQTELSEFKEVIPDIEKENGLYTKALPKL